MTKPTTLFDTIYELGYKHPRGFTDTFRSKMREARRFVLDDDMSAFLADIGWAAYKTQQWKEGYDLLDPKDVAKVQRRYQEEITSTFDNVRHMARLPHQTTWIEWDEKPLARRARDEYGSNMDERKVPDKAGWLMMQHPQIDTAFEALSFGVGTTMMGSEGRPSVGICPFTMNWQSEDLPLPWKPHPLTALIEKEIPIASLMTGIVYAGPYLAIGNIDRYLGPYHLNEQQFVQQAAEQGGMMRYLLGLLATINDLPVGFKHVTASKGFVAKGNYRKFLDHTVVTLKIPADRYKALARKAVMAMRRRAHQVRGHWRDDWRNPGKKIWIKEHQRGDTSLGFVMHDYKVARGTDEK